MKTDNLYRLHSLIRMQYNGIKVLIRTGIFSNTPVLRASNDDNNAHWYAVAEDITLHDGRRFLVVTKK